MLIMAEWRESRAYLNVDRYEGKNCRLVEGRLVEGEEVTGQWEEHFDAMTRTKKKVQ